LRPQKECNQMQKKKDKGLYHYWNIIERTARKYEADLIASGRFKFIGKEDNYNLYKEISTGHVVRVLIPRLEIPKT
jgi:hypothetical protein